MGPCHVSVELFVLRESVSELFTRAFRAWNRACVVSLMFSAFTAQSGQLGRSNTTVHDLPTWIKKTFLWKEPTDTEATFDLREVAFPPIRLVASTFPGIDPATGKRLLGIGCRTARCFWYLYLP